MYVARAEIHPKTSAPGMQQLGRNYFWEINHSNELDRRPRVLAPMLPPPASEAAVPRGPWERARRPSARVLGGASRRGCQFRVEAAA
jgi:hypothetical protein